MGNGYKLPLIPCDLSAGTSFGFHHPATITILNHMPNLYFVDIEVDFGEHEKPTE